VKPCEPGLPSEGSRARHEKEQLNRWRSEVRTALSDGDQETMGELFLELKQLVSADQVSRVWLGEVSGWDARAVTG
jgi:hypothetical protein